MPVRILAAVLSGLLLSLAFEPVAFFWVAPFGVAGLALSTRGLRFFRAGLLPGDRIRAGTAQAPDLVLWPENSTAVDPFADTRTRSGIEAASAAVGVPILLGAIIDAGPMRVGPWPGRLAALVTLLALAAVVLPARRRAARERLQQHPHASSTVPPTAVSEPA